MDEDNGTNFFMLASVTKRSREMMASAFEFKKGELEYLELLATSILEEENKFVSSMKAMNCCSKVEGVRFSLHQADEAVAKFKREKWLKEVYDGKLALGIRFISEMEEWIKGQLGEDVERCALCQKLVVRGCRCQNCRQLYHKYCGEKLAKLRGGAGAEANFSCKKCNHPVKCEITVDATEEERGRGRTPQSQRGASSRRASGEPVKEPLKRVIMEDDSD